MQPHQLTLIYLLYGRIKAINLIASYYYKLNYPIKIICLELINVNKYFNQLKKDLYGKS